MVFQASMSHHCVVLITTLCKRNNPVRQVIAEDLDLCGVCWSSALAIIVMLAASRVVTVMAMLLASLDPQLTVGLLVVITKFFHFVSSILVAGEIAFILFLCIMAFDHRCTCFQYDSVYEPSCTSPFFCFFFIELWCLYGWFSLYTSVVFVASLVSLPPVSSIPIDEVKWYAGTWFDGVVCCSVAIISYHVSYFCTFAHVEDSVVECVFTAEVRTIWGTFSVLTCRVGFDFVCRSRGTQNCSVV